jgi:hypothetical protein
VDVSRKLTLRELSLLASFTAGIVKDENTTSER